MSDIRRAFEIYAEPRGLLEGANYDANRDAYDWPTVQFAYHAYKAALSANGGEVVRPFGYVNPKVYNKGAVGGGISKSPTDTRTKPVWDHPAPPSVAVPDAVKQALECFDIARFEGWDNALTEGDLPALRDIYERRISWAEKYLQEMLTAASSPDHSGDANKMVAPSVLENEIKAQSITWAAEYIREQNSSLIVEDLADDLDYEAARLRTAGNEGE